MAEGAVETGIVIVGAGGCGLTAALAAAERGKRVLVLERGDRAGGSTAMSAGLFVAGSRMQQANGETGTPEELAADIFRLNDQQSDKEVTLALCRVSGPLMDWLAAHGVPLEHMPSYRYKGMSRAWIHGPPQRHGLVMTEALLAAIKHRPEVDLHFNTQVIGLNTNGGTVDGVLAKIEDGGSLTVRAQVVILAASGFGANKALVGRYIPDLAGAVYFDTAHASGDAIQWGKKLGAATEYMGAYQSHSSFAYPKMMLVTTYLINHGAIQVNIHGRRFGDETNRYAGHALAIQVQPDRAVIEIFDEHILKQTLANYPRFGDCLAAGIVYQAQTLEELEQRFGIEGDNLPATVASYNAAVAAGHDEFGRTQFGAALSGPYYGIRVTSALVQTLGGLRVDVRARVLRANGSVLPGLYAEGGTAAGLAGNRPEGYLAGTGLLAAFGLGWIAGRDASSG